MLHQIMSTLRWPIIERIPLFGDAAISPHGLMAAVGFVVGAVLMVRRAERRGLGHVYVPDIREAVNDLLVRAAIGGIVGARLFYVLRNADVYAADPLSVLFIWEGGLSLLGGITGAVLAALPELRRRDYRPFQVLDSAATGLAAGIFVGRTGDLLIGDHIGAPASGFPLAWECAGNFWVRETNSFGFVPPRPYPVGASPTQGCFDVAVHQTALYDFLQAGLLFALLLFLERRPRWDGFFVAVFVYWYGAFRLLSDFLREDRRVFGLTGSQYAALATVTALTAFLAWRKPWRRRPWAWDPPDFDHPWRQPPTEVTSEATAAPQ